MLFDVYDTVLFLDTLLITFYIILVYCNIVCVYIHISDNGATYCRERFQICNDECMKPIFIC